MSSKILEDLANFTELLYANYYLQMCIHDVSPVYLVICTSFVMLMHLVCQTLRMQLIFTKVTILIQEYYDRTVIVPVS